MGFGDDEREMRLEAVHQGVAVVDVLENTGFKLKVADRIEASDPPTSRELQMARSLDPDRRYL